MTPRVFVLRHGRSVANEEGLIASSPANAAEAFGLTTLGRAQIRESVTRTRADGLMAEPLVLVCSPLLRARESAEVAAGIFGVTPIVDSRLTERGFGDYELESDDRYQRVWAADRRDSTHNSSGVESVDDVLGRAGAVVEELTLKGDSATVVLCTHGDVASTLLCASEGVALERHREVGGLDTGALRELASVEALRKAMR